MRKAISLLPTCLQGFHRDSIIIAWSKIL